MTQQHRAVLARKWRPKRFDEVIGQDNVVRALSNALNHDFLHHAYLFTGTRGVGKTTIARILSKCLNCEAGISATPCDQCDHCHEIDNGRFPDLYEVDAASRTKVEDTRDILDNTQYAPVKGRFKIYLIDEVHMLSGHSFNALLKTLEEPPEHVKFLLATTDPQKLPATVLSRCLQFHLSHMPSSDISAHLQHILQQENIQAESMGTELIAHAANGSMRDALSLLDQAIAFGNNEINTDDVKKMLGVIDKSSLLEILKALHEEDAGALLGASQQLRTQGADYQQALTDLMSLLHQITLFQLAPDTLDSLQQEKLKPISSCLTSEDVQLYYQIALIGQNDLAITPNRQMGFEMILLRMLTFSPHSAHKTARDTSARPHSPATKTKTRTPIEQHKTQDAPSTHNNAESAEWVELIQQLNLSGATGALVRACAMESLTSEELHLSLAPSHEPLLNKTHIERINKALQDHFNTSITVKIDIKNSQTPSANVTQAITKQNQQQQAEDSLLADNNVQKLMKTFSANIIKDTIAPTNNN